jgi:hypothetical protein
MRSQVSDDGLALTISIPAKRDWKILFLLAWIIGWTFAGIATTHQLQKQFHLFTAVWMIGWAFGEV